MTSSDVEQLRQILAGVSSSDNALREQAEKALVQAPPEGLVLGLCAIMASDPTPLNRSLAAILFRRTISKYVEGVKLWYRLPETIRVQCAESLLKAWSEETVRDARNKVGDAVAETARLINQHEEWPRLLQILWAVPKEGPAAEEQAIGALRILAAVPECVSNQKSDLVAAYLDQFIVGSRQSAVRLATLKALASMVTSSADDRKAAYGRLVQKVPELLASMAQSGDEEELQEALQAVTEVLDECPKLFRVTAIDLVPILISTVEFKDFAEEVRKAAMEVLTTLMEVLPGIFKKNRDAIRNIVTLLLKASSEGLSQGQEWYEQSPDDEFEEELFTLTAEQALDRMAIALGGAALLPTLMSMIPQMTTSGDWRHRYAALRAIANVAEGCADLLEDRLEELLALVWPAFQDGHPRVQYAACHALGQLCTDFAGTLQERFAPQCLTNLVGLLTSSGQARVQCHAAAALINFAEGVEADVIAPVLDTLLGRLVALLGSSVLYLQEQVLATMAAFSSAAGTSFVRFMPQIMPLLLNCLNSQADKSYRLLQCRALEASTMIAVAVSKENFAAYSEPILKLMVGWQQTELDDDDQMIEYLASAWVRMCQVLGPDFAPFIPLVLPRLLEDATAEPDIAVIDAADPSAEEEYDPAEWEFATIKGKRLGIHTATLDSKCTAVENLAIYIATLGMAFMPYVEQTFATLLPLVHFNMHEGVQAGAAEALANLIKYQMTRDVRVAVSLAEQSLNAMLEELGKERDPEVMIAMLDSMADVLKMERPSPLAIDAGCPANMLNRSFEIVNTLLTVLTRHQSMAKHAGDDDEDDEGDTSDDDESVMYALARLTAALFRVYGAASLGPAESLLQFCAKCIINGKPELYKHAAVCILDDLVHWVGSHTAPIREHIIKCFGKALGDADPDTRQAAVYGIGMCSEYAPGLYEAFCLESLPLLLKLIDHADAKAPSIVTVTDNAMAAVARICQAFPQCVDLAAILPHWIAGLPVTHDEEEAPGVYTWLLMLLQSNATLVLGTAGERTNFIGNALREAARSEGLLPETLKQQVNAAINNFK